MSGVKSQSFPKWLKEQGFEPVRQVRHGTLFRCKKTRRSVILARKHTPRGENNFVAQVNRIVREREPIKQEKKEMKTFNGIRFAPPPAEETREPAKKAGNPNLAEYAKGPKSRLSDHEKIVLDAYIVKHRKDGKTFSWIKEHAAKDLPNLKGSQGRGVTVSNVVAAIGRIRNELSPAKKRQMMEHSRAIAEEYVASTKNQPRINQTPAKPKAQPERLPHFATVILTEPSLTDAEKVKMLCAYASI